MSRLNRAQPAPPVVLGGPLLHLGPRSIVPASATDTSTVSAAVHKLAAVRPASATDTSTVSATVTKPSAGRRNSTLALVGVG